MLVCNQQWTEPEARDWTMWTGYDSPSSVACQRPACLEPLRSCLLKCYVQEMLRAWIFIKLSVRNHVLLRVWAFTLVLGHRPSIYTCLVCFSMRICPKRIWGMIFMILSAVGESRTLCILLLYTMSIYKGKRFHEIGILDIKCHTKKTKTGQFLHIQVLMLSVTHLRLFPSRWDHMLRKKQTDKQTKTATTTTILTHLSKRKVGQIQNWSSLRRTELLFSTVLSFQSEAQTLYVYHMDKQPLHSAKTPVRRSHDQTCHRSNTFKSATAEFCSEIRPLQKFIFGCPASPPV